MVECSIFMKALECATTPERAAFLDEACAGNPELRERVEALLRSHESADSFLDLPVPERLARQLGEPWESSSETDETLPPDPEGDDDTALEFLDPSDHADSLGKLDHYEVQQVIGRGGMGIVLRAFDERLHRVVAIKVMAAQLATSATARKRFSREARAAAAVSHDHIVTIHAVDEANGLPYIAMQYVAGQSLQQRLDRSGPLEPHEILRIGMQTAAGLAAAHAHGLIHRDIKPANILLENGVERVKITDFGLARAVDDVDVTRTGEVAGTPQYMSPEQAQGLPMDARSDLFSLGCVLYALCTGRSPFRAETAFAAVRRVCEDQPRPIREVNPEIPFWLVEIIDRLLAKQAAERFQSAAEVAALLGRHLAEVQHPSTVGRPPAPANKARIGTALRSRPLLWTAVAGLLCLALLLGLSEAGGVTALTTSVIRVLTPQGTLIIEVDDPGVSVTVEGDGGLVIKGAGPREVRLPAGDYMVRATKDGQPMKEEMVSISRGGKMTVSVSRESFASAAIAGGVSKTLAPRAILQGHDKWVESLAFSPDGQTVATSSGDHQMRFWNLATGSQTGMFLADHHNISWSAYSPDGKLLVTGSLSKNVRVWNAATREQLAEVKHADWVWAVAFRRRDSLLATCSRDKTVKLWKWDGTALVPVRTLEPHSGGVTAIAYSPSGDTLAAATTDGMLSLWDVESGQQRKSVRIGAYELRALAFSPDGKTIAVGGFDKQIELRSAETLDSVGTLRGHQEWVWSVAFLPDSKSLISAGGHFSFDTISSHRPGELKLWDLATLQPRLSLPGHELGVRCVALSPDGQTLGSGDFAGVARLWDVETLLSAARANTPPPAKAPFDAATAKAHQEAWARHVGVPVEFSNSIGMKLRLIPPGEFMMGTPPEEAVLAMTLGGKSTSAHELTAIHAEGTPHLVKLTQPFFLGQYEVTRAQFRAFVAATGYRTDCERSGLGGWSNHQGQWLRRPEHTWAQPGPWELHDDEPVCLLTWNDARAFCVWLSAAEGRQYELPTDAQWEFACRAGTSGRTYAGTGEALGNLAWTNEWIGAYDPQRHRPQRVGTRRANAFGLYDMLGNVWEHCSDWYAPGPANNDPCIDPTGPGSGSWHVLRGGAWYRSGAVFARAACRQYADMAEKSDAGVGFRVALIGNLAAKGAKAAVDRPGASKQEPGDAASPESKPIDAETAKADQAAWAGRLGVPVEFSNSIGMKFRLIPPGEFMMGNSAAEIAALTSEAQKRQQKVETLQLEGPQRKTVIEQPFYLGQHEVTVGDFRKFVEAMQFQTDGERSGDGGWAKHQGAWVRRPQHVWHTPGAWPLLEEQPVVQVSWNDAQAFCRWLSDQEGLQYVLPNESHREYAARAGTTQAFGTRQSVEALDPQAWTKANLPAARSDQPQPVGLKEANPFGLHDMLGNVAEWCADWVPNEEGHLRVIRGGGWVSNLMNIRPTTRGSGEPDKAWDAATGFRVAIVGEFESLRVAPPSGPPAFALRFDGQSSHVVIPTWKFLGDHPLTVEAWLTPTPDSRQIEFISNAELGGLAFGGGKDGCYFTAHDGKEYCGASGPWPDQVRRVHLAGVLDGKQIRLYVNGVEKARRQFTGKFQHSLLPLILGGNPMADGKIDYAYAGLIDYVRLSKTVRYERDFTPAKELNSDTDTLALYRFDEGRGDTLTDASGNGHHGMILGARWVPVDGTAIDTTAIDKTATPRAAKAELGAFVVLGGPGVAERKFDTLAAAVQAASDGDTIEIRTNGPFVTKPILIEHISLIIRAAAGFRPLVMLDPDEPKDYLIRSNAPLVLEGLDLQWVNAATPTPQSRASGLVISSGPQAQLSAANCRFLMNRRDGVNHTLICAITWDSLATRLRNCQSIVAGHGNVGGTTLQSNHSQIVLDNCLIHGTGVKFQVIHEKPSKALLSRNTMLPLAPVFVGVRNKIPLGVGSSPPIEVEMSANVMASPVIWFSQFREVLEREGTLSASAGSDLLKQLIAWRGSGNLFLMSDKELVELAVDLKFTPSPLPVKTLDDWKRFWSLGELDGQLAQARFQGGNLAAKGAAAPELLTPEDYRLRPDSPGYRAGPDGKDLGADVDLVGPGPAYERWKKTPEYQEWLKETGQIKERAAVKPEPGPFVVLGGTGVAERKFDTLAAAVQVASNGDTIEVRGNGPFLSAPIQIRDTALTIRAGDDFHPVIQLDPQSHAGDKHLLWSNFLLVLEGLEIQGHVPPRLAAVHATKALWAVNCRFRSPVSADNGAECVLQNCLAQRVNGNYGRGARFTFENCVFCTNWVVLAPNDLAAVQDLVVKIKNNTFVGKGGFVSLSLRSPLADSSEHQLAERPLRLEAEGSIFDVGWMIGFGQTQARLESTAVLSPEESESRLRQQLGWRGERNLLAPHQALITWWVDSKQLPPRGPSGLDPWRQYWGSPETDSAEGLVVFEGGNLASRTDTAFEQLTPDDFRLRPGSAGYRAGPDGKDLGADVDLVGPGPAYERWKKTPEYQEWLKETGQIKERAAVKREPGPFVVLGGTGVAERKFDTLAAAVLGASDGDTIEVRGNGPFVTKHISINDRALVIRAGAGYWPVILADPEEPANNLLQSNSHLVLEGLDLRWVDARPFDASDPRYLHLVVTGAPAARLDAVNCRFLMNRRAGPHEMRCIWGALCHLRNCQLVVGGYDTLHNSVGDIAGNLNATAMVDNCLMIGGGLTPHLTQAEPTKVVLNHNTILGSHFVTLYLIKTFDPPRSRQDSKPLQLAASANILAGRMSFVQAEGFLEQEKTLNAPDAERLLPQLVGWQDDRNLYSSSTDSDLLGLFAHTEPIPSTTRITTLPAWKNFWGLEAFDSQRGYAKFQGGDLVARSSSQPDLVVPEDFRLRPDSPGYRAGKDGKDLGADVDLVGPGAAYELWKQTPEYQEWRKGTGQLK